MNHGQNDAMRHSNSCSFTSEAFKVVFRTEGKHAVHTAQATSLYRHQHSICYRYSNSVAPQNNVLFKVNNTEKENQSGEETSLL